MSEGEHDAGDGSLLTGGSGTLLAFMIPWGRLERVREGSACVLDGTGGSGKVNEVASLRRVSAAPVHRGILHSVARCHAVSRGRAHEGGLPS